MPNSRDYSVAAARGVLQQWSMHMSFIPLCIVVPSNKDTVVTGRGTQQCSLDYEAMYAGNMNYHFTFYV